MKGDIGGTTGPGLVSIYLLLKRVELEYLVARGLKGVSMDWRDR
jgi:hypothetical protein